MAQIFLSDCTVDTLSVAMDTGRTFLSEAGGPDVRATFRLRQER